MNDYRTAPTFTAGKFIATSDSSVERLPRNRYVTRVQCRSRIDPFCIIEEETGARCPRCDADVEKLNHGRHVTCSRCSLHMVAFGNTLFVSESAHNLDPRFLRHSP